MGSLRLIPVPAGRLVFLGLLAALLFGCRPGTPHRTGAVGAFVAHAPHGGTPVPLGDGDFQVELVLDSAHGVLSAYVLDDDLEEFIRSSSPLLTIDATAGGAAHTLALDAVANPATGETAGDTSFFSGQADWLRGASAFQGVLRGVKIRGTVQPPAKFDFPGGNAKQ